MVCYYLFVQEYWKSLIIYICIFKCFGPHEICRDAEIRRLPDACLAACNALSACCKELVAITRDSTTAATKFKLRIMALKKLSFFVSFSTIVWVSSTTTWSSLTKPSINSGRIPSGLLCTPAILD